MNYELGRWGDGGIGEVGKWGGGGSGGVGRWGSGEGGEWGDHCVRVAGGDGERFFSKQ
ncbi:hypothetical protein [Microcystis sp. M60BS1]|uniref:hypothetical protein n=1 Tax=Microcystis sp. M60BS1 TaxID=2771202 RepID=UPI002580A744|nr:hypothetical protein [Microcystis sp. M60BS1]